MTVDGNDGGGKKRSQQDTLSPTPRLPRVTTSGPDPRHPNTPEWNLTWRRWGDKKYSIALQPMPRHTHIYPSEPHPVTNTPRHTYTQTQIHPDTHTLIHPSPSLHTHTDAAEVPHSLRSANFPTNGFSVSFDMNSFTKGVLVRVEKNYQ